MPRQRPFIPRLLAVACLAPALGCSGGGDGGSRAAAGSTVTAAPAGGVVAPARVEVIGGLLGCEVSIRTEAEELREGVCHGTAGDYLITTFPEDRLKDTWLDAASVYGGTYLVGTQWVVSAKPALLKKARPEIGGELQDLSGASGTTGS
ncbi:hypothetical protein ACIPSE_40680 [Streptomyces sp. NPDC090106]|uniref:hypothetical protein n=1 Tax=Streptomyces sp. NPDC090106 TaxID=3365946 RepID=UPI0037FA7ADB